MARPVTFTDDAAQRIVAATRAYERGDRSQSPIKFRPGADDGEPVRLGKTTTAWTKGTTATIDLYETGDPPNETLSGELADCVNKFADVDADAWVMVAQARNGWWYLIAAECVPAGSGS